MSDETVTLTLTKQQFRRMVDMFERGYDDFRYYYGEYPEEFEDTMWAYAGLSLDDAGKCFDEIADILYPLYHREPA